VHVDVRLSEDYNPDRPDSRIVAGLVTFDSLAGPAIGSSLRADGTATVPLSQQVAARLVGVA
jgi:hypothetical protein